MRRHATFAWRGRVEATAGAQADAMSPAIVGSHQAQAAEKYARANAERRQVRAAEVRVSVTAWLEEDARVRAALATSPVHIPMDSSVPSGEIRVNWREPGKPNPQGDVAIVKAAKAASSVQLVKSAQCVRSC